MFAMAMRADRRVHLATLGELSVDARSVVLSGTRMTFSAGVRNVEVMDGRCRIRGTQDAMSGRSSVVAICCVAVGARGCHAGTTFSYSSVNAPLVQLDGLVSQDMVILDDINICVTGVARRPQIVGMHT